MAGAEDRDTNSGSFPPLLAGSGLVAAVGGILLLAAMLETPETPAHLSSTASSERSSARVSSSLPANGRATTPSAPLGSPSGDAGAPNRPGWQPASGPAAARDGQATPSSDEPVLDPLSRRVLEDSARIRRSGGDYTAQLAFVCRRETALRLLERSGEARELFILPEQRNGQDCFRICWGACPTRATALAVAGLPAALRRGLGKPEARRIDELAP